jgi:hypothetical protein
VDAKEVRVEDTDAEDEFAVRYRKQVIGTVSAVPFIPGWFHGKLDGRVVVTKNSMRDAAVGLAEWCGF